MRMAPTLSPNNKTSFKLVIRHQMLNKVNIRVKVHKKLLGCFIMHPTIVTVALSPYIHITLNVTRWKVYLKLFNTNAFTLCAKIQLMSQFQICHCCPSRFISFFKFIFYVLFCGVFKCRNPSVGLTTKARACKVASQERKPKSERK
jgi:hypothetical protein